MNKPALTTALLASLAFASLFTSGCVVGDGELECDASEESADCDVSLGTTEDAISGGINADVAKESCESRYKVWNAAKMSCGGCISGYVPSDGGICISKKQSDCYTKLDGVWQNGMCITAVQCGPGMHPVSGGYGQPNHCEYDAKPMDPYYELPCEPGLLCPTNPNPNTWDPYTPHGWQPMHPGCMDPGDIGCYT